jgi:ferrous-iron efflux pump FieF
MRSAPEPTPAAIGARQSARLQRWSSGASLAVAVLLMAAKATAWVATDSLSLLASVVDALVDILASLVTFLGVRFALRPADAGHRFGHGKAEALAALTQAMLLGGAAAFLLVEGIRRLIAPLGLHRLGLGLGVVALSTLATGVLVLFEGYVARRTQSQAIAADRAHHLSDVVANLAVLAALALTTWTGWPLFDPLFGLALAAFFAWTAAHIVGSALRTLLDHELPAAERQRIGALVRGHPSTRGMHDLRTRRAGRNRFIEFHLELDGGLSVQQAHTIADEIEQALVAALPGSDVIVHVEPAGIRDERLDDRIGDSGAP